MTTDRAILATLSAIKAATLSANHSMAIGRSREHASRHAYAAAREELPMPYDMPYEIVSNAIDAQYGAWVAA